MTLLMISKIISNMNYLLDTHALIWFLSGDKSLSSKARKAIESTEGTNFVSIVSLWEIAIKISLDRLELKSPFEKIEEEIFENGFQILPITFRTLLFCHLCLFIITIRLTDYSYLKEFAIN